MFEKTVFKDLFSYIHKNKLFSKCQACFSPSYSCVLHLFTYLHGINSLFDCDFIKDVRDVCFDILKTFNKVWHKGLL